MNFIRTTSDKLSEIEIEIGNLIFCSDTRSIYLDGSDGRIEYNQITILNNDQQRLQYEASGFYFVINTNILWWFSGTAWTQLNEHSQQTVIYGNLETFPIPGIEGILYMTNDNLYRWDSNSASYNGFCSSSSPEWEVEE